MWLVGDWQKEKEGLGILGHGQLPLRASSWVPRANSEGVSVKHAVEIWAGCQQAHSTQTLVLSLYLDIWRVWKSHHSPKYGLHAEFKFIRPPWLWGPLPTTARASFLSAFFLELAYIKAKKSNSRTPDKTDLHPSGSQKGKLWTKRERESTSFTLNGPPVCSQRTEHSPPAHPQHQHHQTGLGPIRRAQDFAWQKDRRPLPGLAWSLTNSC